MCHRSETDSGLLRNISFRTIYERIYIVLLIDLIYQSNKLFNLLILDLIKYIARNRFSVSGVKMQKRMAGNTWTVLS